MTARAIKDERTRMQYLSALGVDMFVPRRVLTGAKASVQARLPVAEQPAVDQPGQAARPELQRPKAAGASGGILDEILGRKPDSASAPVKSETPPAAPITPPEPAQGSATLAGAAAFTLNIWQINSSLMVVDSHRPKAALPTAALLINMLRAKRLPAHLPGADTLSWPVLANNTGWGAAREMVDAFLQSRFARQSVPYLWLMGEDAFNAIAPEPGGYGNRLGTSLAVPQLDTLALVMPSLAHMLSAPQDKALAWAAIAPYQFHG